MEIELRGGVENCSTESFHWIVSETFLTEKEIKRKFVDQNSWAKSLLDFVTKGEILFQTTRKNQRALIIGGSITVQLVSSLTSLDSTSSLHTNNHIFSFVVNSNLVKLVTLRTTVILPLQ